MEYSTTQQRIAAIGHQPALKRSTFAAALALFGVFSAMAGAISLASAIILSSEGSSSGLANTLLTDTAYEFGLAALIFASSRAFTKGKIIAIWLYGGSIILDIFYNLVTGNPLNYLFIAFGLLLIWQLWKCKDKLDLA